MAMHDLTSFLKPPANLRSLLGLNLKFIPRKTYTPSDMSDSITRFKQSVYIRDFYRNNPTSTFHTNDNENDNMKNSKLYIPTHWQPPTWKITKSVVQHTECFTNAIDRLFKPKRSSPNLSKSQIFLLKKLMKKSDFVIAKADKNLGPCIIERDQYINLALRDHLRCRQTYQKLSYDDAVKHMTTVRKKISSFLYRHRKTLSSKERKYIRKKTAEVIDPFPVLYLLMKIHKHPLKTRPVVSCSGSLLHPIGVWLDTALQPIATSLPSFIGSSYDLKEALDTIPILPADAKLFTADAVSMYTNIDTYRAIGSIRSFLHSQPEFNHLPLDAINDAIELIMTNNVFKFGDCYFRQLTGTAMGTPPACCYATIYYAVKEKMLLHKYSDNLLFYKRYIDDVFAIWVPNNATLSFESFSNDMKFQKLDWEVNPLSDRVVFLDMILYLQNGRVETKLFEKALNLYLYINPFSSHPCGVLPGLIIGNILRIHHLCSDPSQRKKYYHQFFLRLRARGYLPSQLLHLFQRAFILTKTKPMPTTKNKQAERQEMHRQSRHTDTTDKSSDNTVILHVPYHQKGPNSTAIQSLFKTMFLNGKESISGFSKLTIANSRSKNLGEILSYRRIETFEGPPVSSFFD